jgi:tetratricopeptide (TPR) repeat protein
MGKQKQMRKQAASKLSPFAVSLEDALKHYHDARWLGEHSPLASPYLLHEYLPAERIDAEQRGVVLQNVLRTALVQIGEGRFRTRYQQLIEHYYFRDQSVQQMLDLLGLEQVAFHESRRQAIIALAAVLVHQLNPALRLETPVVVKSTLYGRQFWLARCWEALAEGQTVLITGSGGVGKTTLASRLARQWVRGAVFWFTIRRGFNDQLSSLLFDLGYFLLGAGQATLWQQLVAQTAALPPEQALDMVRFALEQLRQQGRTPLLCFDEVDLLRPAEDGAHSQLLTFINDLRGLAPLLISGQQPLLDGDLACRLEGLPSGEVAQMLRADNINLSPDDLQRLHHYIEGNPRLLELFIVLHQVDEEIPKLLAALTDTPSLEYLFNRILLRLAETEQVILTELAVYRNPAPIDIWQPANSASALNLLIERRLVLRDGRGGVSLLSAYRDLIYRALMPGERAALHGLAAKQRARRGAYTAAAFHQIWAGEAERAILEWKTLYGQQEIDQGQAGAALRLFRGLRQMPAPLRTEAQEMLLLICAELERLQGDLNQASADLRSMLRKTAVLAVEADTLEATIANDLSEFTHAIELYKRALATAERIVGARLVYIHKGLGWSHLRERELEAAWRQAHLARYEAENFMASVLELHCAYAEAEQHYQSALQMAHELNHQGGIARTCNDLALLLARQGRYKQAQAYSSQAEEAFQQIGAIADVANAKINMALIANLAGEHQTAVEILQEAQTQYTKAGLKIPPWSDALVHQGLAEAYLGLDDLAKATAAVEYTIGCEEGDILGDAFRTLGEILLKQGRLEQAEAWIRRSLDHLTQQPDPYLEGYAWRALAQVYVAQGDFAAAQTARQQAISRFEQIKLANEVDKTCQILLKEP